jgi:hypothetical protein
MPRLANVLPLLLSLAAPAVARPEPPARAEGRIVSDEGRTEILGRPIRVGEKIELPEGFIRVEEQGTEDGEVGSFTVVSAESFGDTAPAAIAAGGTAEDPAPRPAGARDCRPERGRYLEELWRLSGIEVSSPDAVIEGLEGAQGGPATGFYWFALATDPFRPLAWSSELRGRAEALARCVRGE